MKVAESTVQDRRDQVLKLLSEAERARVNAGDVPLKLTDGEEYIDLAAPENGVRSVHRAMQAVMGQVLSRKVVSVETWAKISERFGTRFLRGGK